MMKRIAVVCTGVMAAVLLGAGCKAEKPINPGASQTQPSSMDSTQQPGTGGSGLGSDTTTSPGMNAGDRGTGGAGRGADMREPAPGTTRGNDASHSEPAPQRTDPDMNR